MILAAWRRSTPIVQLVLAAVAFFGVFAQAPCSAQPLVNQPKYAAVVIDAASGEALYAVNADAPRHPASITKVMTLYLTFEALEAGRLKMSDRITISPHAFSMMPSKVSSRPGESLTVAQAIPAMTVHSANDVAVAMAERLGGSEARFAALMTKRAHQLGMNTTHFVNASGLPPDGQQISSAHDIAILCRAVMRDFPQYYGFFGLKSFTYHGRVLRNHNHLVANMPGVDGMKTGFTNLAGYNLAASGVRGGHRLITVVLGGPSVSVRDHNVEDLLNAGFQVLQRRAKGDNVKIASLIGAPSAPNARPRSNSPRAGSSRHGHGLLQRASLARAHRSRKPAPEQGPAKPTTTPDRSRPPSELRHPATDVLDGPPMLRPV